ncbi:MAG: hypothetical protein V3T53_00840 [Phycisphaerales bacterium]
MYRVSPHRAVAKAAIVAAMIGPGPAWASPGDDDPFADVVVDYVEGKNAAKGYTNPDVVLNSPERFTGEGIFPGVVSAFNPAFGIDEIVSIGRNGHLIVSFDTPVTDDPANPFGIDLLIFGNTGFIDANWPNGVVGGMFGNDGGFIEVSIDGVDWFPVKAVQADGLFPTIGYLDSGPYDDQPGSELTDFILPVDPSLALGNFLGLNNEEILELYGGSGGGVGVDLAAVGLDAISFVRVFVPDDARTNVEIDAFSDVAPTFDPADLNMDGSVGAADLLILLVSWGPCPDPPADCPADLDGNGSVGAADLLILLAAWG